MSIRSTPFEGANGASLSTTNHGGPTFDVLAGTWTYTNTRAAHGSTSVNSSQGSSLAWTAAAGTTKMLLRAYVYLPAAITVDTVLLVAYQSGSGVKAAQLIINSANKLRIQTYGAAGTTTNRWSGATGTTTTSSTATVPVGAWTRLEFYADAGTSATTGSVWAAMYAGDSTAPIEQSSTITEVDVAGTSASLVQGRLAGNTTFTVDDFGMKDGADATRAAWTIGNQAPTVTAPADVYATAGVPVTVTATASDLDGDTLTHAWTVMNTWGTTATLANENTPTVTVTLATAGGVVQLLDTVSDGTESATYAVKVHARIPGGSTLRPLSGINATKVGFTRVGTATNDGDALADNTAATYLESGDVTATEQYFIIPLQPSEVRSTGSVNLHLGLHPDDPADASVTYTVQIRAKGATVETYTQTVTKASGAAFYTKNLAPATIAALDAAGWISLSARIAVAV